MVSLYHDPTGEKVLTSQTYLLPIQPIIPLLVSHLRRLSVVYKLE